METAVVRLSMPGGVGGQRREPLPTRLNRKKQQNYYMFFTLLLI